MTARQLEIVRLVKMQAPITGEQLAEQLGVSRPTLRSDLSLLVMLGLLNAKPKVGYYPGRQEHPALQQLRSLNVRQVQALAVCVSDALSVHDAVITLFTDDADTLLVVNEHRHFVGIVTPKDLLKVALGNPNAASLPVSMVMTRYPNIVTVAPDEPIAEAIRKLIAHQLDCLPVLTDTEDGMGHEVVGIVNKTIIIQLLKDLVTAAE